MKVNILATVHFMLCAGADMGALYIRALKNQSLKGKQFSYSKQLREIMHLLDSILHEMVSQLSASELKAQWQWVERELDHVGSLIAMKAAADENFRAAKYSDAITLYANALQIDATARKWNAILHSNRAAAYMALGLYEDAILDCDETMGCDFFFDRAYLRRARACKVN